MRVAPEQMQGRYPEHAQVCVVGSGPAGLTLAHTLATAGIKVFLVEAGGLELDDASQDAYKGEVIGDPYFDLSLARLRYFGGTSNHWTGWCRPLTAGDFLPNPARAASWPILAADLEPFNDRASDVLEIPHGFPVEQLSPDLIRGSISLSGVNFGVKYLESCDADPNLRLFLNSTLVNLSFDGDDVRSAEIRTNDQRSYSLAADNFVLCLGGIENSRLLRFINEQNGGVLPSGDLIGRYWMEHPHVQLGDVVFFGDGMRLVKDPPDVFSLYLSDQARVRAGILNAGLVVDPHLYRDGWKADVAEILCVAPALGRRLMALADEELVCGFRLRSEFEQQPVAENRVALGQTADAFGVPRTELHWRRSEADRATIADNARLIAEELARLDLGRIRLADWVVNGEAIPDFDTMAGWHHMGGTRMGTSASDSVVDANLKVHGIGNLYVGGSSVFPTSGFANPTYTIVRLSLRLADHLSAQAARMQ
jgi:choline dehydrogenase-like flavoprotein